MTMEFEDALEDLRDAVRDLGWIPEGSVEQAQAVLDMANLFGRLAHSAAQIVKGNN